MTQYFEDLAVGERHEFGERTVTREEIVDFAERYDPQPFHVDEAAAEESIFGGLIASGWHTICLYTRMLVDGFMRDVANMGGRGADDVRWRRPVRPGDALRGSVEVLDTSATGPERGDVSLGMTCFNQDDEAVLTMTLHVIVMRRSAADS
jgi:acyl dehydratase